MIMMVSPLCRTVLRNSPFSHSGKEPTEDEIEAMISEAAGPINFTMFLTMFGEKLNGTDPEDVIKNAFGCFDEEGSGM
jgi:Ca2+-binding EF-hand superfamily protein